MSTASQGHDIGIHNNEGELTYHDLHSQSAAIILKAGNGSMFFPTVLSENAATLEEVIMQNVKQVDNLFSNENADDGRVQWFYKESVVE